MWQYSRRLDVFALAICALETLMKLHLAEYPSDAASRTGPLQAALAHSAKSVRSCWSAYWSVAVNSFDLLAEYSRLVCCGDQQGAAKSWKELVTSSIPHLLQDRLHELCDGISSLAKLCRRQGDGCGSSGHGPAAAWAEVGTLLDCLHDMVHEGCDLDWPGLAARLAEEAPEAAQPGQGTTRAWRASHAASDVTLAPEDAEDRRGHPGQPASEFAPERGGDLPPQDERDLEVAKKLYILKQVESEVLTLKHWYSEALEAMRPPALPAARCGGSALAPRGAPGRARVASAC